MDNEFNLFIHLLFYKFISSSTLLSHAIHAHIHLHFSHFGIMMSEYGSEI